MEEGGEKERDREREKYYSLTCYFPNSHNGRIGLGETW